ncbi:MAG: hypothetical protein ACRDHE_09150, partial [Ktedonobacterales bacterium]
MCNEQPEIEPPSAYVRPPTDESAPTTPPGRRATPTRTAAPPASVSLSALSTLTHLLTLDLSPDEALRRALTQAARLLPEAEALAVVTLAYAPRRTLELAARVTQPAATPINIADETLGLGADMDERVLDRRQQVQGGVILCAPLLAGDADLLGVLLLRLRETAGPPSPALAIVRDTLSVLLTRRRSSLIAARVQAALDALPALAHPEELAALDETDSPAPGATTDVDAAEWAVLR